jgi:hypothetical protein
MLAQCARVIQSSTADTPTRKMTVGKSLLTLPLLPWQHAAREHIATTLLDYRNRATGPPTEEPKQGSSGKHKLRSYTQAAHHYHADHLLKAHQCSKVCPCST